MGFIGANAQVNPIFVADLPSQVDESSGLEFTSSNNLWSHNDTDFDPRIFRINESGALIGTVDLTNVTVVDFEDVAYDGLINFFIGDFGNNLNDRTDLKIYKIPNPELLSGSIVPEIIQFSLSDQAEFPPSENNLNFDIEGMFFFNDHLHLFTRNRTNPFDGLIKHYKLSTEAGNHVAELQGTFFGNLSDEYSSVTAADISDDGNRMVLLTEGSVFLFHDYTGEDFFNGEVHYNFFDDLSAKEGIVFKNDCEMLISEESPDGIQPGKLLSLNSCDLVPLTIEDQSNFEHHFSVDQSVYSITIQSNSYEAFHVRLFDSSGVLVYSSPTPDHSHFIDINSCNTGIYILNILQSGRMTSQKILISD